MIIVQDHCEEPSNGSEDFNSEYFPPTEDSNNLSIVDGKESTNEVINKMEVLEGQSVKVSLSQICGEEIEKPRKELPEEAASSTSSKSIVEEEKSDDDSCVCHNLKKVIQKLQIVSDKLAADSLCDSYDEFSKYISSLLRGLPQQKALNMKKKLVNDIIEVLLTHERGDQDSSLAKTTPKRDKNKFFTKRSRKLCSNFDKSFQESTEINSKLELVSGQSSSSCQFKRQVYCPISIPSSAGTIASFVDPSAVTQCESIRTVTSTADGTLVAVTLPTR